MRFPEVAEHVDDGRGLEPAAGHLALPLTTVGPVHLLFLHRLDVAFELEIGECFSVIGLPLALKSWGVNPIKKYGLEKDLN